MTYEDDLKLAIRKPYGPDRRYLDGHTQNVIREACVSSGVKPGPAQVYVANRIRYHLGVDPAPPCPNELRGLEEWAKRRAFELVEANERRLPAREHARDL